MHGAFAFAGGQALQFAGFGDETGHGAMARDGQFHAVYRRFPVVVEQKQARFAATRLAWQRMSRAGSPPGRVRLATSYSRSAAASASSSKGIRMAWGHSARRAGSSPLGRFAADDEPTAASGKFAQHALGRAAHGVQAAHQNCVIAGLAHAQALALRRSVLGHQPFIAIVEIDVAALQ